jgi:chromate transporter
VGVTSGVLFFLLLALLPLLAAGNAPQALKLFDSFFRAGSLVFGGGHVVLPLLQAEVVPPGWVTKDIFLAGYGAAQAIPGPLFSFSAYLGAASRLPPNGFAGAALCLAAAFLPSFLLMFAVLPFWDTLRRMPHVRSAITGINAVVVGLLLSALVRPVGESALRSWTDAGIATALFLLLTRFRVPSWAVVILAAMAGKFLTV